MNIVRNLITENKGLLKAGWIISFTIALSILFPQLCKSRDMCRILVAIICAPAAILLCLQFKNDRHGFCELFLLGFAAIGIFTTVISYIPFGGWLARPLLLEHGSGQADAIVVMAAGSTPIGGPVYSGYQRILHGYSLLRKGSAPRLILNTGFGEKAQHAEKQWVASFAALIGIPHDSFEIISNSEITTTCTEAKTLAKLLFPRNIKTILLVTNGPHILRSVRSFEKVGFKVLPAPVQTSKDVEYTLSHNLEMFNYTMHEWLGLALYRLRGDIKSF